MQEAQQPSWLPDDQTPATILERNWLFELRRERFRSRGTEKAHDYYVMRLADSVNVLAVTPERELLLVRQFRAGSRLDSLETPGGLVDAGEDPLTAGLRELREETGFEGTEARLLGTVWSNPSIMTARASFIVVEGIHQAAEPSWDETEELTIAKVAVADLPRLIREGRIDHSLTVCAILWWLAEAREGPQAR